MQILESAVDFRLCAIDLGAFLGLECGAAAFPRLQEMHEKRRVT